MSPDDRVQMWICDDCMETIEYPGEQDQEEWRRQHYTTERSFYVPAHPPQIHGEPANLIDPRDTVVAGVLLSEHWCGIEQRSETAARRYLAMTEAGDRPGWNCARIDYTVHRPCDACGCRLGGARNAYVDISPRCQETVAGTQCDEVATTRRDDLAMCPPHAARWDALVAMIAPSEQ